MLAAGVCARAYRTYARRGEAPMLGALKVGADIVGFPRFEHIYNNATFANTTARQQVARMSAAKCGEAAPDFASLIRATS